MYSVFDVIELKKKRKADLEKAYGRKDNEVKVRIKDGKKAKK